MSKTNISLQRLNEIINNLPTNQYIYGYTKNDIVLGSITFICETKLIHDSKCVLHIEDLIIRAKYRKSGIGTILLEFAKQFAVNNNCYKIILDCKDSIKSFYEKNNYVQHNNNIQMSCYL